MVAQGVFTTANLTSYCSVDDILALLEGHDLSEWGDEAALRLRATQLLGPTKSAIDSAAGRDFMLHADATVTLDGSGDRSLLLSPLGLIPVVKVDRVSIEGKELAPGEWLLYPEEACIVLAGGYGGAARFPAGDQNVELVMDWGYEAPPSDIVMAQAKLAAAELLAMTSGDRDGVEAVRVGDYSVRYGSSGRFAHTIRRLALEAAEAVARHRQVDMCAI
ncbi:MAG: hypothetical protein J7M38_09620 [Armatimonadetes bacterium]|nr:hypothetical protein [Armatimonadota bacterium]